MSAARTARPTDAGVFRLGEGPVWDPARNRLLWVDIAGHALHEGELDSTTGAVTRSGTRDFTAEVGAVAVAASGELLVAERETLTRVGLDGTRTELARVLPRGTRSRLNDGAVDPAGRFLVGSLDPRETATSEVLVRLGRDGLTTLDADLTMSNGLAWNPAGDRLYSIDTVPGTVWVRDYDAATGATGDRHEAFRFTDDYPDGMCADADGNLWIAIWGGGRVECRSPDGRQLATVTVDAPHTTSVTFAGPGLDLLVITTATTGLSTADLAHHPGSGRLFTARVDAVGLPGTYWNPAL
ncbi:SMP-30/gluconolactonase/LRE family protein [Actinoplanes sp. N902-109]|uniref:SMP-30/gluconolactonase/LRE family protein n=1 Tax=Actinoplanes sp. (strain N902-109) TaxID=649831 RepID=UPI00032938B8|nr:SMP-30/gluconolactonase/LRE family protein [Actinoplanes sp. N902-109]AGL16585.1 Gluconolactonase [Actinoplanes sp. N902-109]